jgi:tRNA dimethylallyltransferase
LTDPVLAVFGPTASGKSAVASALAKRTNGELVNCDAMQLYAGLPILTNQAEEPTRLVAVWPLSYEGSVAEYQRLAHAAIDELVAAERCVIVVGGTGLYLRAALGELALPPAPDPGLRSRMEALYDRLGGRPAHELLARRDPDAASIVHANDRRRVVRALELTELGSSLQPSKDRLWDPQTRYPTFVVGLEVPKALLDRRIEERTRAMFERGVVEEVRRALAGPISSTARTIYGLREIAELPPAEALDALAQRTRRYASYQRKWMRRIPGLVSVRGDRPPGEVADEILEMARTRQPIPARRAL